MGLKRVLFAAVSATTLMASAANADFDRQGWYVGLEAGWVQVGDTELLGSKLPVLEFKGGLGVLATAGYDFQNSRWRLEGEIGYRTNDIDAFVNTQLVPARGAAGQGSLEEWSAMLNLVYDIKLASDRWGVSVGGGIGLDNARFKDPFGIDDNDKNFAAQGILGLTYRLSQHADLVLNYRYLWVNEAKFQTLPGPVFGGVPSNMDLDKHTVTIGFRYGYDDPPPPAPVVAPPVQAPPPPKSFIIFFGFNKCNITAEADAVLSEAASAAKSGGSASVKIVGHTDSSGSNAYNQKLSECRANAAKSNLVGKGVSEGSISTSGKGESELMVQTGDGVKEPQNRRATINID